MRKGRKKGEFGERTEKKKKIADLTAYEIFFFPDTQVRKNEGKKKDLEQKMKGKRPTILYLSFKSLSTLKELKPNPFFFYYFKDYLLKRLFLFFFSFTKYIFRENICLNITASRL